MAYQRINWQDGESGNTPLSAENLNKMDKAIEDISNNIGDLSLLNTKNKDNLVNAINDCVVNYIDNKIVSTNEFLDGKRIYAKRVIISKLPNSTNIEYATGLPSSGISVVRLDGLYGGIFPINFIFPIEINLSIGTYWYAPNKIQIITGSDRSNMGGYVDVYFYYNQ